MNPALRTKAAKTLSRVKLGSRRQIALPSHVIKRLRLKEGEDFELGMSERDKAIILMPRKYIPKDQAWFWTDAWQEKMRRAEADVKAGRVRTFENVEDLIKDLNA